MALCFDLLNKLNEDQEFDGKLRALEEIINDFNSPVPNGVQVVISWLFSQVENESQLSRREYLLLWETFEKVLKLGNGRQDFEYLLAIKSSHAKIVLEKFKVCTIDDLDVGQVLLSCIWNMMQVPSMAAMFSFQYETLVSLFSSVLNILILSFIKKVKKPLLIQKAVDVLRATLSNLESQSSVQDFGIFAASLEIFAVYFHFSEDNKDPQLLEFNKVLSLYIGNMFFHNHSLSYEKLLKLELQEDEIEISDCTPAFELLVEFQGLLCNQSIAYNVVTVAVASTTLVKKLMEGFLQSERKNSLKGIHIAALLSLYIGIDVPLISLAVSCSKFRPQLPKVGPGVMIMALENVTRACSMYPRVFHVTSSTTENEMISNWFKNLCSALLHMDFTANESSLLSCLQNILTISSSAIDFNLPLVFKKAWFKITGVSNEIKKHHSAFFNDLLKTYGLLCQLPMFFEQFFDVMYDAIEAPSTYQRITLSKSINCCFKQCLIALPIGRTLTLWQIFISTIEKLFSLWLNKENKSVTGLAEALFLTSELFSTFLRNAKLFDDFSPASTIPKILSLIEETNKFIIQALNACVWQNTEDHPLCISVLMLCNATSELQLTSNIFMKNEPGFPFIKYTDSMPALSALKTESSVLYFLAMQLHLQNSGSVLAKSELTDEDRYHIREITALILESAVLSYSDCNSSWNMEISSLNDSNYGVAVWMLLLKRLPQYMDFISNNNLGLLCSAMVDILIKESELSQSKSDEEITLRSVVSNSMTSFISSDSKILQSAFVLALWKHASTMIHVNKRRSTELSDADVVEPSIARKIICELFNKPSGCMKYALSIPEGSKEERKLNRMWRSVREAATLLNNWLETPQFLNGKLKVHNALHLSKVINSLCLVVLMPGNQIKCTLGLSVLLLLLPNSCKDNQSEVQALGEEILEALFTMFRGVRCVWLFDFVHVKPYLKAVVNAVGKIFFLKQGESVCNSIWPQKILEVLFELSTKNMEHLLAFEEFAYEITSNITEQAFVTLACSVMLQRLACLLQRSYQLQNSTEVCQRLVVHICSVVTKCLKSENEDPRIYTFLVKCYTVLLELTSNANWDLKEKKQHKFLKKLPNVIQIVQERIENSDNETEINVYLDFIHRVCLSGSILNSYMPDNFCQTTWKALMCHFQRKFNMIKGVSNEVSDTEASEECKDILVDEFKSFWTQELIGSDLIKGEKFENDSVSHFSHALSLNKISLSVKLSETEATVLRTLIKMASIDDFNQFLQEIAKEWGKDAADIFFIDAPGFRWKLVLLQYVIDAASEEYQKQPVSILTQNCIMRIYFLLKQVPRSSLCLNVITLPSLEFIAFVLQKKIELPEQSVIQCLHSCVAVEVESYVKKPHLFTKAFIAVWNILNILIVQHSKIVFSCLTPFMPCVANLLKAIIKAGDQDLVASYDNDCQRGIQQCASNIDRLFIVMVKHKTEINKLVPYLIADYVDLVQNVTVHPLVKEHLVLGLNRLFGICTEVSIKTLSVTISHGGREIFNSLLQNYKRHRYQGRA